MNQVNRYKKHAQVSVDTTSNRTNVKFQRLHLYHRHKGHSHSILLLTALTLLRQMATSYILSSWVWIFSLSTLYKHPVTHILGIFSTPSGEFECPFIPLLICFLFSWKNVFSPNLQAQRASTWQPGKLENTCLRLAVWTATAAATEPVEAKSSGSSDSSADFNQSWRESCLKISLMSKILIQRERNSIVVS